MSIPAQKLETYFTVDAALRLNTHEVARLHAKHLNAISAWILRYVGTSRRFIKAEGIHLIDEKGDKHLDFLSGFGALNLGHEPAEILETLRKVEHYPNILQTSLNPFAATLAEFLATVAPGKLSRSFFCNSGAESVEAAIKLARCVTGKRMILSTENAFHGKTCGALSVSGKHKYKKPFEPLIPETHLIPYNDLGALEKNVKKNNVAGFIVEPIQGEAGVIVPDKGYLIGCQHLCNKYAVVLIVDEVQTGMGRTGRLFCCEHENVEPDILCLSKSLGGGIMPIGAMVTTNQLWNKAYGSLETCLLHSSTFGGNSRACACAITALNCILKNDLMKNAEVEGEYLLSRLRSIQHEFPHIVKEVTGKGLMIGIHFARLKGKSPVVEGALTLWIVRQLFRKHKILTAFTLNNYDVLRIMPPLTVERHQIDTFLQAFEETLKSSSFFAKLQLLKHER